MGRKEARNGGCAVDFDSPLGLGLKSWSKLWGPQTSFYCHEHFDGFCIASDPKERRKMTFFLKHQGLQMMPWEQTAVGGAHLSPRWTEAAAVVQWNPFLSIGLESRSQGRRRGQDRSSGTWEWVPPHRELWFTTHWTTCMHTVFPGTTRSGSVKIILNAQKVGAHSFHPGTLGIIHNTTWSPGTSRREHLPSLQYWTRSYPLSTKPPNPKVINCNYIFQTPVVWVPAEFSQEEASVWKQEGGKGGKHLFFFLITLLYFIS